MPKPEKPVFEAAPRPEEKLSDFFGEAKKSSGRKTHSASDEEEELYASGGRMGAEDVGDEDEEGVVDVGTPQVVAKEMDLDEFLRKRLRYIYTHVSVHTYIHTCTYVHNKVYTCTHTHTQLQASQKVSPATPPRHNRRDHTHVLRLHQ